jgi:hypothetical protein
VNTSNLREHLIGSRSTKPAGNGSLAAGCKFNLGSPCTLADSATDAGLTFQPQNNVSAGIVDLGTFTLAIGTGNFGDGDLFSLRVTFTDPTNSANIFAATLSHRQSRRACCHRL